MERRCKVLGIAYEEPSPEPRRELSKVTLTKILRTHFRRPLPDGGPPNSPAE